MPRPRYGAHRIFLTWNDDQVTPLTLRTVRWLTVLAIGGYVVSRLLERAFSDTIMGNILAGLTGLVSVASMLLVLSSRLQRLLSEAEPDEYQRSRRDAALVRAYTILSGLIVVTGFSAWIMADRGRPLSLSSETLTDLGAGAMMLAILLPVTLLAWSLDLSEDPEAPEDDEA